MANDNKTVTLDEKLKAERALFLRKTDEIPGTDMTLDEARAKQQLANAEFEKQNAERALRVKNEKAAKAGTSTSMVVPGVNMEVKVSPVVPQAATLPELPSDDLLKKMKTAELITLATSRGVEVKANVDTEAAIIARLKGEYTDARFAPLPGKSREVLDGYAAELGLGANPDELKENFANVELLSEAIEQARKK